MQPEQIQQENGRGPSGSYGRNRLYVALAVIRVSRRPQRF